MAQFAAVCPIQMLEQLKERKILGTYHLLLAHHVLEYPDRFKEVFKHEDLNTKQHTIIMDNSIVELGDAASDAKVLEAVKALQDKPGQRNWIIPVLTDVMGDGKATRKAAHESYNWWKANAPEWPLMVVLQGNDWADFCRTADYFLAEGDFPQIEYVGIPRVLVKALGSRQTAIQYVDAIAPNISTHLLGFSDDVTDDIICANIPTVEGIDSAVPLRYDYSVEGDAYTPTADIPARPPEWFKDGQVTDATVKNLYNIRRWVA
jgi:hypothetical protein